MNTLYPSQHHYATYLYLYIYTVRLLDSHHSLPCTLHYTTNSYTQFNHAHPGSTPTITPRTCLTFEISTTTLTLTPRLPFPVTLPLHRRPLHLRLPRLTSNPWWHLTFADHFCPFNNSWPYCPQEADH